MTTNVSGVYGRIDCPDCKRLRAALEFVAEMALLHAAVLFAQGARVIDAKLTAIALVNKYLAEQEKGAPPGAG